ncbi:MAG: hypothetical protein F6K50_39480, partial [Moorea sp. SIO3I7]|nr:hypothetical protein [Moorena sp. SIO3I7]
MPWVSCRAMGIWLCHGHLAVPWASCRAMGILVERASCRAMDILVERASWWNGHLARFNFRAGSMRASWWNGHLGETGI